MKKYLLLGANFLGWKAVDYVGSFDELMEWNDLANSIERDYRMEVNFYEHLFLVDRDLKVYCKITAFTECECLKIILELNGDLNNYKPIITEMVEGDDIAQLNDILKTDKCHRWYL